MLFFVITKADYVLDNKLYFENFSKQIYFLYFHGICIIKKKPFFFHVWETLYNIVPKNIVYNILKLIFCIPMLNNAQSKCTLQCGKRCNSQTSGIYEEIMIASFNMNIQ